MTAACAICGALLSGRVPDLGPERQAKEFTALQMALFTHLALEGRAANAKGPEHKAAFERIQAQMGEFGLVLLHQFAAASLAEYQTELEAARLRLLAFLVALGAPPQAAAKTGGESA